MALSATTIAGCGGGGSAEVNNAIYGAIATQVTTSGINPYISSKYTTQSLANSAATQGCEVQAVISISCFVRIEFVGTSQCGAAARGDNSRIGYATGNSIQSAQNNAVEKCQSNGGTSCATVAGACN